MAAIGDEPRTKKENLGQCGLTRIVPMIFPLNETAFLQKPFTPLSLARKVREELDGAAVR